MSEAVDSKLKEYLAHAEKTGSLPGLGRKVYGKLSSEEGRVYHRIVQDMGRNQGEAGQRSAVAFVHKDTGDIYKSASWNSPAKGVRGNIHKDTPTSALGAWAESKGGSAESSGHGGTEDQPRDEQGRFASK